MPKDVLFKGKVVASLLTEADVPTNYLITSGEKVAVIGYGIQGRAQSLNLRESGVNTRLGLRRNGGSWQKAIEDGWKLGEDLYTPEDAVESADVAHLLVPDMEQPNVYRSIRNGLKPGKALIYAHGFSHVYKQVVPPDDIDVGMVAPKGPGAIVRREFEAGFGVPSLFAVAQDYTSHARDRVLGIAKGIGSTRPGILETTFKDEVESDNFGEQVFLCGGIAETIKAAYETLLQAGYNPVLAYWEIAHEAMGLIAPLFYNFGAGGMYSRVSDTAKHGGLTVGPQVIDDHVKENMRGALEEIRSGRYASKWIAAFGERGRDAATEPLKELAEHPVEIIGEQVRRIMWPDKPVS